MSETLVVVIISHDINLSEKQESTYRFNSLSPESNKLNIARCLNTYKLKKGFSVTSIKTFKEVNLL